ncbi:HAD family hydrolase [Alloprevotella sp. OH1205_COT-284]|uniref:HAD family hydrolase n=1 Tax=Alloprevotella sp. OH1205_COT-284 TaxID=2491043 RepID=UPI000F5F11A8|nr:HAD family hydrolase [Alloprevotella sp. OH1205_COT-284]RRD80604.1 HAD family hydrolase [Alloprevotella sp. OH1205_COT-284]
MITTVLFDLDGTLLDTLTDLSVAVNHALQMYGLPQRSKNEVRAFLGNGIRNLITQCVPNHTDSILIEKVFVAFRTYYLEHCLDNTVPYPGIPPLLEELHRRGVRIGLVSNKVDTAVQELHKRFFADTISVALGESSEIRRKPHPAGVLEAMRRLKALPEETLYVGDSEVDFETSRAAGINCALVFWGFRDEIVLRALEAEYYFLSPEELLSLC